MKLELPWQSLPQPHVLIAQNLGAGFGSLEIVATVCTLPEAMDAVSAYMNAAVAHMAKHPGESWAYRVYQPYMTLEPAKEKKP